MVTGFFVDRAGQALSGSLTLTPGQGAPRSVRVWGGCAYPTVVPAGVYTVSADLRSPYRPGTPVVFRPVTVTVPAAGSVSVYAAPTTSPPAPALGAGGPVVVTEVAAGIYEITGATVVEAAPGAYTVA